MIHEFVSEEEAMECLGEEAARKIFNVGYSWAIRDESYPEQNPETEPERKRKVFIGAYCGNSMMYVGQSGRTTFVKAVAKQFDDSKATDTKISMMNRRGNYKWQKVGV